MKTKINWTVSILVITTLVFSATATAMLIPASDKAKEKAPDKSPVIDEDWNLEVPTDIPLKELEKVVFIHYKDKNNFGISCNDNGICEPDLGENPSCGDCKKGNNGDEETSECYDFIRKNIRWRWTEDYVVSSSLNQGVIDTSANTWDEQVLFDIFGTSRVGEYPWGVYDESNSLRLGVTIQKRE